MSVSGKYLNKLVLYREKMDALTPWQLAYGLCRRICATLPIKNPSLASAKTWVDLIALCENLDDRLRPLRRYLTLALNLTLFLLLHQMLAQQCRLDLQ